MIILAIIILIEYQVALKGYICTVERFSSRRISLRAEKEKGPVQQQKTSKSFLPKSASMNGIRFNRKHCLPRKLLHMLLDLLCPTDTRILLATNVEVMQSTYQLHQMREKSPHLLQPTNLCT